jgi:hypothetical protein
MLSPQVSGSPPSIFTVTPVRKLLVITKSAAPRPLDGLPQPAFVAADLRQLAEQLSPARPR